VKMHGPTNPKSQQRVVVDAEIGGTLVIMSMAYVHNNECWE